MPSYYEFYRGSTIGMALLDSLDELIREHAMSPHIAILVMKQFDKSIAEAFEAQVRAKCSIKGHLHTYRLCDDVWQFFLQNVSLKVEGNEIVTSEKIKIVACKSGDAVPDASKK